MVQKALSQGVAQQRRWLRLLHYRKGSFSSSYRSEVDDANFFLSPRGQFDAEAELIATLRGLFSPALPSQPVDRNQKRRKLRHPLCRYPARASFLIEVLAIDPAMLPRQRCEDFVRFVQEIDPSSVTVIFSSYYLNNPASAFGHTFLRFNSERTRALGKKRELLDHSIDFAADVDTGNALVYAFKGIFGLFPGTIKRKPYYYKVRQYADYENRDIWEYELNLSQEQLYLLLAHIWEVGDTFFRYYYMDENCSYRVDMMLEAAHEGIELMEHLKAPILPADTVKVLFDNPGLVKRVSYRPSLRTRFRHAVVDLSSEQKDYVERLRQDPTQALPRSFSEDARASTLEAAVDLIELEDFEAVMQRDSLPARHKQTLLERRAQLPIATPTPPIEPPWREMPQRGHGSKRLGVAGGIGNDGKGFVTLDARLAMHDLADPADGYPELSQIEFLPLRLQVGRDDGGLDFKIESFSVVRIVSLNSMERFDMGLSWKVDAGARTLEQAGCERCFAGVVRAGTGPAKAFFGRALTLYLTTDAALLVTDEMGVGIAESIVRAGLGPAAGMRLRLHPSFIFLGGAEWLYYPSQPDPGIWQLDATVRWSFASHLALSLEGRALRSRYSGQLFLLSYF
ncbi:MAG: DUF4105 domain-containing protein [Myxococcales bacterium]|nr:DUF4105 domain-containing protein [Myxococcales bacterium]